MTHLEFAKKTYLEGYCHGAIEAGQTNLTVILAEAERHWNVFSLSRVIAESSEGANDDLRPLL